MTALVSPIWPSPIPSWRMIRHSATLSGGLPRPLQHLLDLRLRAREEIDFAKDDARDRRRLCAGIAPHLNAGGAAAGHVQPIGAAVRAERTGRASALFDGAALEELAEFILALEPNCKAKRTVADADGELAALVLIATPLLNDRARYRRVLPVFPDENLHSPAASGSG